MSIPKWKLALVVVPLLALSAGVINGYFIYERNETAKARLLADQARLLEQAKHRTPHKVFIPPKPPSKTEKDLFTPLKQDAVINVEVQDNGTHKPIIKGTTNLPDGTSFMVSIDNEAKAYSHTMKIIVRNKNYQTEPFSNEGKPLGFGNYEITVIMPIPEVQTPEVRKVIGEHGEYLKGPLVSERDRSLKKNINAQLGSIQQGQANKKTQAVQHAKVKAIYQKLQDLLQAGKDMTVLRNSDKLAMSAECGHKMRLYQSQVREIKAETETLPMEYIHLKAAAGQMNFCVSCSNLAERYCPSAEEFLKKAATSVQ